MERNYWLGNPRESVCIYFIVFSKLKLDMKELHVDHEIGKGSIVLLEIKS